MRRAAERIRAPPAMTRAGVGRRSPRGRGGTQDFRTEVRAWLDGAPRRHPRPGPARLGARAGPAGWIGLGWDAAARATATGPPPSPSRSSGPRSTPAPRAPARVGPHRREPPRPHPHRVRHRGAEAPLPARHRPRRGALVPGLQRTRRRVRPRRGPDHRRAGRDRRLRTGHRPEDLDLPRPGRRLVLRPRPHRARLAPPPRTVLPARADGPAGPDRGAADPPDDGDQRVQRGLLRRGAGRAEHVVGGEGNGWRVAMGLLALERGVSTLAQQIGFAQELERVVGRRSGDRGRRGPGRCATGSYGSGPSCAPCAGTPCAPSAAARRTRAPPAWPSCCGAAGTSGSASWRWRCGARRRAVGPPHWSAPDAVRTRPAHSTCSCSPGPTPSTAARTRSSATSSPSGCSACRGSRRMRGVVFDGKQARGRRRPGDTGPGPRRGAGRGRPPPGCATAICR